MFCEPQREHSITLFFLLRLRLQQKNSNCSMPQSCGITGNYFPRRGLIPALGEFFRPPLMIKEIIRCILCVLSLQAGECFAQDGLTFPTGTAHFADAKSSVALPAKFVDGHIFVETYFGERGPYYFALDTGGLVFPNVTRPCPRSQAQAAETLGQPKMASR